MKKLIVLALPCLLIFGCPKDKSNTQAASATVLTGEGVPTITVPPPASPETPYNDPFAGTVITGTGSPDFGHAPDNQTSYEIMTDTFYDWTPEEEKLISEKLGRQFEPFRTANKSNLVSARKADGWQRYVTYPVPGVKTKFPNPFINATHHLVMYKRAKK
jgi:hypothetical protein